MRNTTWPLSMVEINSKVVAWEPVTLEEISVLEPRNTIHYLRRAKEEWKELGWEIRKAVIKKINLVLALRNRELLTSKENCELDFWYAQRTAA